MYQTFLPYSIIANIILSFIVVYISRKLSEQNKHFHDVLDRTRDNLRITTRDLEELKKKFDKRPNSKELDEFIMDIASSGKSILEVKRIDASNLFIWNK